MRRRLIVLLCVALGVLGLTVGTQVATASPHARPVARTKPAAPAAVTHLHTYAVRSGASLHWKNPSASRFDHVVVRYARGYTAPTRSTLGKRARLTGRKTNLARLGGLTDNTVYTVAVWTVDAHGHRSPARTSTFTSGALRGPRGAYVGRVVDDQGHPLLNAEVSAGTYSAASSPTGHTTTDVNGRFRLRLVPGTWFVDISGQHISGGDSDPTGYLGTGEQIVVHSGQTVRAGNVTLTRGAAVTGRVTDSTGDPLAGVGANIFPVQAYVPVDSNGGVFFGFAIEESDSVFSGSDGRYTLKGVPVSTALRVCVTTAARAVTGGSSDDQGYADRCLPSAVSVARSRIATEPDLTLDSAVGGEVSGAVTTPTGTGLGNWGVSFEPTRSSDVEFFAGAAVTKPNGSYEMAGLRPGTYRVCAEGGQQPVASRTGYIPGCYRSLVRVVAGGRATADLQLAVGAAVTGKVTGPRGVPIGDVEVEVGSHGADGIGVTDAAGHYKVEGIPTGEYVACFETDEASAHRLPTGVRSGCFGHQTHFGVRAGSVRNGVDARLGIGGAIAGVLRDATGKPVPFANVEADPVAFRNLADGGFATTDAKGRYVLRGLVAAKYQVCFDEINDDLSDTRACHHGHVAVAVGRTVRGVDGAIGLGASIAVTVHDTAGHPVAGVDVTALKACPERAECEPEPLFSGRTGVVVDASSATSGSGKAVLRTLRPGRYAVCLFAYYAATTSGTAPDGYADRCSGSTFTVVVRAGGSTALSETLSDGGAVSGTVTDGNGHPLAGVVVHVTHSAAYDYSSDFVFDDPGNPLTDTPQSDSSTRADGTFTIRGVRPGTSTVCADASSASGPNAGGYFDQCLGGRVGGTSGGTGVTVTTDTNSGGNDLALTPAAGISGTVIGPTGRADDSAGVVVFAGRTLHVVAEDQPDQDGTYTITQLPTGSYSVCVFAFSNHQQSQCYRNVKWKNANRGTNPPLGRATPVMTTDGSVTDGIDFHVRK